MPARRIGSYFNLGKDLNAGRTWLASHGPIMAGLSVGGTWDNATASMGISTPSNLIPFRGGHAVCVVGYRADRRFIEATRTPSMRLPRRAFDECFGAIAELVGFFRRHPGATRRQMSGLVQLANLDHVIARNPIG